MADRAPAQTRPLEKPPGKLELRLKSSHPFIRSGAPFVLELEFQSTFRDVIEGPLELTFLDDNQVGTRFVTGPFAIPPESTTSHQVTVPAMTSLRTPLEFQLHIVLNSKRRTFNLGTFDLLVPLSGMRQFVVAAAGLKEVDVGELARHLSLDEFRPPKLHRQNFATFLVELDVHRILADPIALYGYDVVIVPGKQFSSLSARQLATLSDWVDSGGGLVVVPTGALAEIHGNFLAKLTGTDRTHFSTDVLGRLPQLAPGQADWLTACHFGFGRALILRSIPQFTANTPGATVSRSQWIRAVGFLWNVRAEQVDSMLKAGFWALPAPPRRKLPPGQNAIFATTDLRYASFGDPGGLRSEPPAAADGLRDMLFPADVRVVPFGIVVGLLASFLIVVAPADYFFLGWLRRRRYTWVVFPSVALLFTALTVGIANHYSGNADHRSSLVIVDVGQGGRPLRTTRIVHVITASTRDLTAEIRDGLFAKTDVQPLTAPEEATSDPLDKRPVLNGEIGYEGLVPSAFTVTWPSWQWSPALHRLTHARSDIEIPDLDWKELDRLDLASDSGRRTAVERIRRTLPDCALLFSSGTADVAVPFPEASGGTVDRFRDWPDVLSSLGRRRDRGLLAILFGVSPSGAGDLEDLAVLDDSDAATWLIHVAIGRGNDLIVFRHVVRKSATQTMSVLQPPTEKSRP
jgi:hypothetical protein